MSRPSFTTITYERISTPYARLSALRPGNLTLHLINEAALPMLHGAVADSEEAADFQAELRESYASVYDDTGKRTDWGCYTTLNEQIVGFSLLSVESWRDRKRRYTNDAVEVIP